MPHGRKKTSGLVLKMFASLCHLEIVQVTKKNNLNGKGQLTFLPPATKLGQGYIFTGVCDSVYGGVLSQHALQVVSQHALQQVSRGISSRGVCSLGGCLVETPLVCSWGAWWKSPQLLLRAVRILLECILVNLSI